MEWMINEALPGRICQGKSHAGDIPEVITLTLNGRRLYQLQKFLENEACQAAGDYFRVRWVVLMAEELRRAVYSRPEESYATKQVFAPNLPASRPPKRESQKAA
jgi:hypothetical protein